MFAFVVLFSFVLCIIMYLLICQYLEMYKRSIEDPSGFWSDIASSEFYWKEKWGQQVFFENLDVRKGNVKIEVLFFFFFKIFGLLLPFFVNA